MTPPAPDGAARRDALGLDTIDAFLLDQPEVHIPVIGKEAANRKIRVVQLPFNQPMTEGYTRFSQATGHGNVASSTQASHQLRVYAMASHTLGKGLLARQCADGVAEALADLANDAQRAMQFNRSAPGIGTSLVGVSNPDHLDNLLAVARRVPLTRAEYLKLYERA